MVTLQVKNLMNRKRMNLKSTFILKNTSHLQKNKGKNTVKAVPYSVHMAKENEDAKKRSNMVAVQWELPCSYSNLSLELVCCFFRKLFSMVACFSVVSFYWASPV